MCLQLLYSLQLLQGLLPSRKTRVRDFLLGVAEFCLHLLQSLMKLVVLLVQLDPS